MAAFMNTVNPELVIELVPKAQLDDRSVGGEPPGGATQAGTSLDLKYHDDESRRLMPSPIRRKSRTISVSKSRSVRRLGSPGARPARSLGGPVISVDTKKKELVGPFRNAGRELRPKGDPEPVLMHDFVIPELGRASRDEPSLAA